MGRPRLLERSLIHTEVHRYTNMHPLCWKILNCIVNKKGPEIFPVRNYERKDTDDLKDDPMVVALLIAIHGSMILHAVLL